MAHQQHRPLVYCVDAASSASASASSPSPSALSPAPAPPPCSPLLGAHEDVALLSYDDASRQLLAVKGSHVFCYDASGQAGPCSSPPPNLLRWAYPLQDGPPVRALRVSPPRSPPSPPSAPSPSSSSQPQSSAARAVLLVQRAPAMLEVVDLHSGSCSVHSAHRGRGAILGFFFTPRGGAGSGGGNGGAAAAATTPEQQIDVVVVTTRAVEMCSFVGNNGLRMRRRERGSHAWCAFSHEAGLLVVGGAACPAPEGAAVPPPGSVLSAWQFSPAGAVVRLPRFELKGPLPARAAARAFMPAAALAPPLVAAAAAPVAAAAEAPPPPPPLLPISQHRRSSDGDGTGGGVERGGRWGSPAPSVTSTDAGGVAAATTATAAPAAASRPRPTSAAAFCPRGAVRREDIALLRMHGRVLLAHVRRPTTGSSAASAAGPRLDLYRVFADAVLPTYSLPLPREAFFSKGGGGCGGSSGSGASGGGGGGSNNHDLLTSAAVAVVDDALVLLHPATGRATVLDAAPWVGLEAREEEEEGREGARGGGGGGGSSHEPPRLVAVGAASSPLRWLSRGADGRWRAGDVSFAPLSQQQQQPQPPVVWPAVLCGGVAIATATAAASAPATATAAASRPRAAPAHRWRLFPPNVLVDTATNAVGRLTLDLSAAAAAAAAAGPGPLLLSGAGSSSRPGETAAALACFLQRRRAVRPAAVARAMRRAGRRQALVVSGGGGGGGGGSDDDDEDDEEEEANDADEDARSSPRELLVRLCAAVLREATCGSGSSSSSTAPFALSRLWGALLDGYALAAAARGRQLPRAAAALPPWLPPDTPPAVSVLSPAEIVARVLRPAAAAAVAAEQAQRRSSGSGEGAAASSSSSPPSSSSLLPLAAAAAELASRLAARGAPPPPALPALQCDLALRAWWPRDPAAAAWVQPGLHAGGALAAHLEAFARYAAQEAAREEEKHGGGEEEAAEGREAPAPFRWEGGDEDDGCARYSCAAAVAAAETAVAVAQLAIDAGQRHLSALEERRQQARSGAGGGGGADDDEAAAAAAIAAAARAQLRRLKSAGLSMRARRLARAYGLSLEVAAAS